jgi:hypothetical protein
MQKVLFQTLAPPCDYVELPLVSISTGSMVAYGHISIITASTQNPQIHKSHQTPNHRYAHSLTGKVPANTTSDRLACPYVIFSFDRSLFGSLEYEAG